MAEIHVLHATMQGDRIATLQVQFPNAKAREIDRATLVRWLRDGHSFVPVAGHGHDVHRGAALSLIELGDDAFVRSDTRAEATDRVTFPGH